MLKDEFGGFKNLIDELIPEKHRGFSCSFVFQGEKKIILEEMSVAKPYPRIQESMSKEYQDY